MKLALRRGYNMAPLDKVVETLSKGQPLPVRNRDHDLTGDYAGFRECHIAPNWLLIYRTDHNALILYLLRTGTHSDLF